MGSKALKPTAIVVPFGISLEECFSVHKENLVILRRLVEKDLQECGDIETKKDDLFLIRFLLSARGNIEKAASNVRSCLAFRKALIEDIKYVKEHGDSPDDDIVSRLSTQAWVEMGELKHPTLIIRASLGNAHALTNTLSRGSLVRQMLMVKEVGFQRIDLLTRETGRLVKQIHVIDLSGFGLSSFSRRYADASAEATRKANVVYPQCLGKLVFINVNFAFRTLFKAIKPLVPRAVLEKQTICPYSGRSRESADIMECPFVRRLNAAGQVPAFLGGKMQTPSCLLPPLQRRKGIVRHDILPHSTALLVERELSAESSVVYIELVFVSSGVLTFELKHNSSLVEEPLTLSLKDGLVKRRYEMSTPGSISFVAKNSSRYTRKIELALGVDH